MSADPTIAYLVETRLVVLGDPGFDRALTETVHTLRAKGTSEADAWDRVDGWLMAWCFTRPQRAEARRRFGAAWGQP